MGATDATRATGILAAIAAINTMNIMQNSTRFTTTTDAIRNNLLVIVNITTIIAID